MPSEGKMTLKGLVCSMFLVIGISTGQFLFGQTLHVSGIFDAAGTTLVKFERPMVLQASGKLRPQQDTGVFCLVVHFEAGGVQSYYFDAWVEGDTEDESPIHGFFSLTVPFKGVIEKIEIMDGQGVKTFGTMSADKFFKQ